MSTQTHPAVDEYLTRTQAALADLPASEVEEILEDIGPHLAEIAGELGEDVSVDGLTERLGTPEQYASELRAAAGYPPAEAGQPARRGRTLAPRFALWALVYGVIVAFLTGAVAREAEEGILLAFLVFAIPLFLAIVLIFTGRVGLSAVAGLPEYHAVRRWVDRLPPGLVGYVRSLRPAWWLVRILALVLVVLLALGHGSNELILLSLVTLVLLVFFGVRGRIDGRWRWVVVPANAFAAGVALALLATMWAPESRGVPYTSTAGPPPDGTFSEGRYVSNIYAFGPDGKPLPEVYLYDQDGRPINLSRDSCDGWRQANTFPQPRVEINRQGQCQEITGVPFTVAIPTSDPPPSTSTSPPTTTSTPPTTSSSTPPTVSTGK